ITLQGWTECEVFEASGSTYAPPEPVVAKAAVAAAKSTAAKQVEFYYSSTQKPGQTFPCDIKRALELVKQLQAKGVTCKATDVDGIKDRFPTYHKSVTGPALLVFEGDRYPVVAFPRTDAKRGTIRVEQALEDLIAEAKPNPQVATTVG